MGNCAPEAVVTRRMCLLWCVSVITASFASRASDGDSRRSGGFDRLSAIDIAAGLRAGDWTSQEVTQWYLQRINRLNGPFEKYEDNGGLNAFIRTYPQTALNSCEAADRSRQYSNWAGIPVALKDVFSVASRPVTVGTPAYRNFRASDDCTVWKKWQKGGAVLVGHTQCQRFVTGLTTPQTANPWNPRLIAGGSSGGSAAAVAAGLVPVALGAETDGSMIYPAACCGVSTLKPSHGLLSLAGVYPGLPAFDVVGPLARSVADCAWALATLAGEDAFDPLTAAQRGNVMEWPSVSSHSLREGLPFHGLRFLISTNESYSNLRTGAASAVDVRVQRCFASFLQSLRELGAEIIPVEISRDLGRYGRFRTERDARLGGLSAHDLLETADCLSAHYPGMYRWLEHASPSERAIAVQLYEGEGDRLENRRFLEKAAIVNEKTMRLAQERRNDLRREWEGILSRHDCDAHIYLEIGSPLPERKGIENTPAPAASREGVIPCDLGWPVLSMPVAVTPGLDAPVSAQIMARRWHDHRLLRWGMEWQRRHASAIPFPPVA